MKCIECKKKNEQMLNEDYCKKCSEKIDSLIEKNQAQQDIEDERLINFFNFRKGK